MPKYGAGLGHNTVACISCDSSVSPLGVIERDREHGVAAERQPVAAGRQVDYAAAPRHELDTGGIVWITMTPLQGMTALLQAFYDECGDATAK